MKTHIETRNGKPVTVIKKPFDAERATEQLKSGDYVIIETQDGCELPLITISEDGGVYVAVDVNSDAEFPLIGILPNIIESVITILPALPKYPSLSLKGLSKTDMLFCEYMANGLKPVLENGKETTHCIDVDGNRYEIAIINNTTKKELWAKRIAEHDANPYNGKLDNMGE